MYGPVFVPLVTPEKHEDFFPLIEHVLKGGVQDLVLFGTTGEGLRYNNEMKKVWIQKIRAFVGNRARLTIGLLSKNLQEACELAAFCEVAGVQAALFPPMLYGTSAEEIVAELMRYTKLPIFLYNPPAFIGKSIPDITPFIGVEQIIGMKDSAIQLSRVPELVRTYKRPNFAIYLGREDDLEQVFNDGIDGLVSGSANVFPELFMNVWKRRDQESFEALKSAKESLCALCPENYIQSLKLALQRMGVFAI